MWISTESNKVTIKAGLVDPDETSLLRDLQSHLQATEITDVIIDVSEQEGGPNKTLYGLMSLVIVLADELKTSKVTSVMVGPLTGVPAAASYLINPFMGGITIKTFPGDENSNEEK